MIKQLFDSFAEKKVFGYLQQIINTDFYIINVHTYLREIYEELSSPIEFQKIFKEFCGLYDIQENEKKISDYLGYLSYDFIIYNKSFLPILILEVNGRHHLKQTTKNNDRFKNFMAGKNEIPFATLILYDQHEDEEIKNKLVRLIEGSVNKYTIPVYCKCKSRMICKQNYRTKAYYYECPKCKNDTGKLKTVSASKIEYIPLLNM